MAAMYLMSTTTKHRSNVAARQRHHKYRDDGGLKKRLRQTSKHENTEDEKENKEKGHQRLAPRRGSH